MKEQGKTAGRRVRTDAARNRMAILAAAEDTFVARGRALSTEEVAKRAGIGVGTVFRHFPTKAALLQALLEARLQQLAAEADALTVDDRGEALFVFFERLVDQSAKKRALLEALAAVGVNVKEMMLSAGGELRNAFGRLLERAQRQGVVRADVSLTDVLGLLLAVAHGADQGTWDRGTQRRAVSVVVDGLRKRPPRRRRGGASGGRPPISRGGTPGRHD